MRHAIIMSLLVLLLGAAHAAETAQPAKISVQFSDVDITQALETLSQKSQVTILGDSSVKGKVSCNLFEKTVEEALGTLCTINKLVWYKAYIPAATDEKPNAGRVLAMFDALQALGGSALICEDPKTKKSVAFVPTQKSEEAQKPEAVVTDMSALASSLNLKPVYVLRADPQFAAQTPRAGEEQRPRVLSEQAPAEVRAAANEVWGFFSQMPTDQQFQVMRELGRMLRDNITPEQMEAARRMFGGGEGGRPTWGNRGDNRDGERGGDPRQRGDRGGPPRPQ
jgi:hypothetical protein